jgi:carboxylesterase
MTALTSHKQSRVHLADESIRIAGGSVGILFIHGLGGTPVEMRYVAQALSRAGHTVHVPQLAGHCGSAEDLKATSWQDWYSSVEAEHRLLRETCKTVVVGGLSMGAVLALHHAAQHPRDVSGLALYAPCLWLDGWSMPWYSPLFSIITLKWFADLFAFAAQEPWGIKHPRIREIVKQAIKSGDSSRAGIAALPGGQMLELRRLVQLVKQEVPGVRQPALIIHSREDDHASLRNLEFLQANLGGQAEAAVLNDCYHIITLDQQRQFVVDRTIRFLSNMTRMAANMHVDMYHPTYSPARAWS